tara:strand:+ start:4155 stop:4907 length:753 start_codon:yes stop_codon:yes gene_type:complete
MEKKLNYIFCVFNNLLFVLIFCLIYSNQVHAFFESRTKYDFEKKWLILLNDISPIEQFKAMRAFLLYPEWGLPVLRNEIKNSEVKMIPWQIGSLIGMLGDKSDAKNLLKIWNKIRGEERSNIFFGAIQRIYLKQKISKIVKPKILNLSLNLVKNESSISKEEKTFSINYHVKNLSKSNIFLRVEAHFWRTKSHEDLPPEFLWLNPGEQRKSKKKITLIPNERSKNIRLDFRIWEVGEDEYLFFQTIKHPI